MAKKFEYDPTTAFQSIVGGGGAGATAPESAAPTGDSAPTEQESLKQKNVKFYPSQLRQLAHMAVERGIDQSALLREVWDEYYGKHKGSSPN